MADVDAALRCYLEVALYDVTQVRILSKSLRALSLSSCNLAKRSLSPSKRRSIPANSAVVGIPSQDLITLRAQHG
jgi:hypothetical protein